MGMFLLMFFAVGDGLAIILKAIAVPVRIVTGKGCV